MRCNGRYLAFILLLQATFGAATASERVYVFQLDRQYWDVQRGHTLSDIAAALLPHAPEKQRPLMRAIFEMNPGAFIDGSPDRLRSGVRLWLPGGIQTYAETPETDGTVQYYDWGSIRRRRQ